MLTCSIWRDGKSNVLSPAGIRGANPFNRDGDCICIESEILPWILRGAAPYKSLKASLGACPWLIPSRDRPYTPLGGRLPRCQPCVVKHHVFLIRASFLYLIYVRVYCCLSLCINVFIYFVFVYLLSVFIVLLMYVVISLFLAMRVLLFSCCLCINQAPACCRRPSAH